MNAGADEPLDPDEVLALWDEYRATTLNGAPYGVIDLADLIFDLEMRVVFWVAAQAGDRGMPQGVMSGFVKETIQNLAAVLVGEANREDFIGARIIHVETEEP